MAFSETRLPARLAFGSSGGVERRTDIVQLASGCEQRSTPWADGRRRYLIGGGVRPIAEAQALVAFFEARRGRLYGFRFQDFADFSSAAPGAAVTALDQPLGTGDGTTTVFQLAKTYGAPSGTRRRSTPACSPPSAPSRGTWRASTGRPWRVGGAEVNETPSLSLLRAEAPDADAPVIPTFQAAQAAAPLGPPALFLLDLPPLEGFESDLRPLAAVSADPWRPFDVSAGPEAGAVTVRATADEPATVGVTLADLAPGPRYRFDNANTLTVRIEGGVLASVSPAALYAGANAVAVLTPTGQWEIVQFLTATLTAPSTYLLSGLLRAQQGSDPAMAQTPAGAPVVVLNGDLARANVALAERGLPLIWIAAPSGAPPAGLASTSQSFAWQGIGYRPFSPCRLAKTLLADGTLRFDWIRRARIGGDNWDGEPPLSEESEAYLVTILNGGAAVRTIQTGAPTADYAPADQAADFPSGAPSPLTVSVQQLSATFGWGAAATRAL